MILRSLVTVLLIVPLALAFAACGDDDDGGSGDDSAGATTPASATTPPADETEEPTDAPDGEETPAPTEPAETGGADGAISIDMDAQDFAFSPASISATAGEEVTVNLTNTGAAPHTFTIDALGVDLQLSAGEDGSVTFTPTGDDAFYCRFHRGAGMEGTLSTDGASSSGAGEDPSAATINEFDY